MMKPRLFFYSVVITLTIPLFASAKPNILWVYVEDLSPWFDCYGDELNAGKTPVTTKLAEEGALFTGCYMPSPTCSTTRSALITGTHQGTFGLHNHRSSRTEKSGIYLPDHVKTLPELFLQAGYETFNLGKDDYNFIYKRGDLYSVGQNKEHKYGKSGTSEHGHSAWRDVPAGKPWFGQIQLQGGKGAGHKIKDRVTDQEVTLPPYFPLEPVFIKEWSAHYNCVRKTDIELGKILENLKQDGLLENTIVFFFSDHGSNRSLRHKQFCYEGGLHVPLIIQGKGVPKGTRADLVSGLDISATALSLAGITIPDYVQGHDLFAEDYQVKDHVVSARDRCDYTIDQIRSVRTEHYRYLKNGKLDRPLLQPQYRDPRPPTQRLRALHKNGKLDEMVERTFFGPRPAEELYDLRKDPHQIHNLAEDPKFAKVLATHRQHLKDWIETTGDQGQHAESRESLKACLDRWKEKCVNPEFDAIR